MILQLLAGLHGREADRCFHEAFIDPKPSTPSPILPYQEPQREQAKDPWKVPLIIFIGSVKGSVKEPLYSIIKDPLTAALLGGSFSGFL